jgi:SAM-dependent methyltransferase
MCNNKRHTCASCNEGNFSQIYDFGRVPLAGSFPTDPGKVKKYPLKIIKCKACELVQTNYLIDPEELFKDYRYISSVGMQKHFDEYAEWLVDVEGIDKNKIILEFGCNDGPLLYALKQKGITALGVDPASNIVKLGQAKDLLIIDDFFNYDFVNRSGLSNHFDYILSSNSFAHIEDIQGVIEGVKAALVLNGKFIFEVQYLVDLVDKFQFDFMYHEHLFYYTLTSLQNLFKPHGLTILDFERIPIHSGSIRVIVGKGKSNQKVLEQLKAEEPYLNLNNFSEHISTALNNLKTYLKDNKNLKIAGYGASGRANVVTSVLDLDQSLVQYIIDESPERYNKWTANGKIPIFPPEHLVKFKPDVIVVFAWNFADMIIEKTKHLGIPYIIPFPELKIINSKLD